MPDIFINMIKQTWNISSEEKYRILNLHESATKNLYLVKEQVQGGQEGENSWTICSRLVVQSGNDFFVMVGKGSYAQIPRLSEVSGVIQNGELVLNQKTKDGLDVGEWMHGSIACSNEYPETRQGNYRWFCYFDDISSKLVGSKGVDERYVKDNIPVFGVLGYDGSLGTGREYFVGQKIPKDKEGLTVQFGVSRTKSYILEISPAMDGQKGVPQNFKPEPKKEPTKEVIELNIESPFVFDKTDLTPEAETQFRAFIEKLKKDYQNVPSNVEVITSASIDAEPSSKEKYNMDLSTRRANAIIDRLKSELGQTKLTFTPKPIGQTDKFSPGLKWPEVKDNTKTAPNRRLIIKLPKLIIQRN
jgi:outer membrane protein OmpA-like peptidoglycan-associated protein